MHPTTTFSESDAWIKVIPKPLTSRLKSPKMTMGFYKLPPAGTKMTCLSKYIRTNSLNVQGTPTCDSSRRALSHLETKLKLASTLSAVESKCSDNIDNALNN